MEVVEACGKGTVSSGEPSTKRSIPSIDNDEVVGFEKDAEIIMKKLTGGTKGLDVISIYGMGGLGKTTLTRKVYNNPSIVNYFDVKAWCSVSQTYNGRTLLIEILQQAINKECIIKENDDVADMLRRILIGRRYLIVLDDIWEVEAWEDLRLCFPRGEDGNRVMVTTRIEDVAKHLQHRSDPYSLRFLTLEESWELLHKKVFHGESCPLDLVEAGLQVAQHCKGLPLVIVLIAGIITKMERVASLWLEVANHLSSLALGEQSMKVIQSSYDHLENHLKPCLLYMGLFPEDHKIPMYDLLKLWMAEEFVLNAETENMEEASRACLNDLLNRSLVMVSEKKINGDIESCILHDVVREFCLKKLIEEKFMQLTVPYSPYQNLYSKEPRLSIYIHDELVKKLDDFEYQLDMIPMLESKETKCFGDCPRSLEFIAHPKFNTWNKYNRVNPLTSFVRLKLVRVMHLLGVKLQSSTWTSAVQSLTHLRYLGIHVQEFDFKWVSHLQNLQTLKVSSGKKLKTSAAAIWKMRKLRHVDIRTRFSFVWEDDDGATFEESSEMFILENMKTLWGCLTYVDDMNPRFWWRFPNLEELSLFMKDVPSCSLFPKQDIHNRLQSLDLRLIRETGYWNSVGWAKYIVFPSNLRDLAISGRWLTEEIVSNIARLRKLESLEIFRGFCLDDELWDVTHLEFRALKYLTLRGVTMGKWNASDASFPMLEKLVLRIGYYFKEIPPSFVDIPTLRLIEMSDCIDSLKVSAMNIKREIEENTGCDSLQVLISS
ncbi:hypothetical protein HAX54_012134 [Datura stramonium]|uniref:Uncharacterized protein n=1 Tax=Datura stramonium TaxID=4076 RepID=A0ABS8RXB3_DATST|nr:hypothetical protein [Datura stramonium]